jgi:tRNA-uridine 2-sulfurtransferase
MHADRDDQASRPAPRRTLVALSGGVDSATVAGLLAEAGESLVGVFMRNGVSGEAARRSCCALSDARDARAVADRLGFPFYVHDMERPFARLMRAFAEDYAAGLTPNPCIVCNNELKFGELVALADDLGCDAVATGHYARSDGATLRRGADRAKDQSYLLHGLTPAQLRRARFPLGALDKAEVRAHARRLSLPVADKPDSADICFVPGGDYRAVVEGQLGGRGAPGRVLDAGGRQVGRHDGVAAFTVGQRRGLGVALGEKVFVTAIDPESGDVRVGPRPALGRAACRIGPVNLLAPLPCDGRVLVQLRHHHEPEPAHVAPGPRPEGGLHEGADGGAHGDSHGGRAHGADGGANRVLLARFDAPSEAVCPGQYAVLYDGDRVLGGGRIRREGATSPAELTAGS